MVVVLDERHQERVPKDHHHHDLLSRVLLRVRVGHHTKQGTGSDGDHDLLAGDAALGLEPVVLLW